MDNYSDRKDLPTRELAQALQGDVWVLQVLMIALLRAQPPEVKAELRFLAKPFLGGDLHHHVSEMMDLFPGQPPEAVREAMQLLDVVLEWE